jgi:hypothetical protein
MVSMRYAKNLVHGYGLVWNPGGERIEGFTNPLWVLYMAGLHLLPIPAAKISLLVQLTSLVCLALTFLLAGHIARYLSGGSPLAFMVTALLTAFYYPLNNWALQGMEVGALALLVTAAAWLAVRSFDADRVAPWLYPLLGISTALRPDALVPYLAILGVSILADRPKRRQHFAFGLAVLLLAVGGQTILRWWYYGELLPNTYYLKMTGYPVGLRIARGAIVTTQAALRVAVGLLLVLPALAFAQRDRRTSLLGVVVLAQVAYSVYVGGDAWEWAYGANRYLVIAAPVGFALIGIGLARFVAECRVRESIALGLALASIATVNAASAPNGWRKWGLLEAPLHVEDNAAKVRLALALREMLRPTATVAVVWAGAEPYFLDRPAIDLLGKTDSVIARRPMHLPGPTDDPAVFFWPGHLKYDYAYSIGQLKPDVVLDLWCDTLAARAELTATYAETALAGKQIFVRRDLPWPARRSTLNRSSLRGRHPRDFSSAASWSTPDATPSHSAPLNRGVTRTRLEQPEQGANH